MAEGSEAGISRIRKASLHRFTIDRLVRIQIRLDRGTRVSVESSPTQGGHRAGKRRMPEWSARRHAKPPMSDDRLPPVHPGEVLLEDFLVPMGLSQYALAKAIGVPPQRVLEIVHGRRAVTADTRAAPRPLLRRRAATLAEPTDPLRPRSGGRFAGRPPGARGEAARGLLVRVAVKLKSPGPQHCTKTGLRTQ